MRLPIIPGLQQSMGVLPETLYFIGGEVAQAAGLTPEEGYELMTNLKNNYMGMMLEVNVLLQTQNQMMTVALCHDIVFDYIAKQFDLDVQTKLTTKTTEVTEQPELTAQEKWNELLEEATGAQYHIMMAIEEAVENEDSDELDKLMETYPDLVELCLDIEK